MARRFWFPVSTAAAVSPAYDSGWQYVTDASRRALAGTWAISASTAGTQIGGWPSGQYALDRQYVSAPLKAQTISGTVKAVLMVREWATSDNVDSLMCCIKVVSNDGATERAVLLAIGTYHTPAEFISATSYRNQRFLIDQAISSYTCIDGDRLVVEIGYTNTTLGTTPSASARYGGMSECAEDDTGTGAAAGWIEFSATIGNEPLYGSASLSSTSALTAVGEIGPGNFAWLAAASSLTAVGDVVAGGGGTVWTGTAALESTSATTAAGGLLEAGSAALVATAVLTAAGGAVLGGNAATLAAEAGLEAVGGLLASGAAQLAAFGELAAVGGAVARGQATLASESELVAVGFTAVVWTGAALLEAESTLSAAGSLVGAGVAALVSTSTLSAAGYAVLAGAAALESASALVAIGRIATEPQEDRTVLLAAEPRLVVYNSAPRIVALAVEPRLVGLPAEPRTIEAEEA